MAREDIVSGVFGLTPEMYQAGQTQRDIAEQQVAQTAANESGGLFAKAYAPQIQQQAQLNARALGGLLGVEDPQLQMVREVSNIRNQFDITTPEGMQSFAQAIAPKYPQLAMQALDKVATLEDMRSKAELRRAQADKALRGPVTSPEQLLTSGKYTPASIAKFQQSQNPADLVLVKTAEGAGGLPKPLPASLQKDEGKDLESYDAYSAQKEALMPSIVNLTPDAEGVRKLELGPLKNAKYMAQNLAGNSTPESRAYEGLKSAVDTAVNLQVSAEKGVQTDKDVLRFANALIAAYGRNDTQATLEALKRYYDAVNRAQEKTAGRIESRRKSQNVEPYFQGQAVTTQPATAPQQAPKTIKFSDLPK